MAVTPMWLRDARISPDGKEIAFVIKEIFIKYLLQVEKLSGLPRKILMKHRRFGRPMANSLLFK